MQRTTVNCDEQQLKRLAHHSQRTGASQSELLRRALDAYLDRMDEEEFHLAEYRTSPPPVPAR